jgi:hypothetical protein
MRIFLILVFISFIFEFSSCKLFFYSDQSTKLPNLSHSACACSTNIINNNSQNISSNLHVVNSIDAPEWLHFDDTRVKLISDNEFHRKIVDSNIDSPYILFYKKYIKNTLDLGK